jgi:hypothetical protein
MAPKTAQNGFQGLFSAQNATPASPQTGNDLEEEARWTRKKHKRACTFSPFLRLGGRIFVVVLLWFFAHRRAYFSFLRQRPLVDAENPVFIGVFQ